ncbi:Hypothetical protein NTJ_01237 [Nesidiocoris tenuis]|uniref:Uncharacterized protein n=1 Tax=Nesidiocoris tenuis TaxID=355587 RepID=A0ABN7A823_9HEMI|nr:Hypothetical protein NTJ_01237 [Nesidiocoris tenuis]
MINPPRRRILFGARPGRVDVAPVYSAPHVIPSLFVLGSPVTQPARRHHPSFGYWLEKALSHVKNNHTAKSTNHSGMTPRWKCEEGYAHQN